jgi:5,6-dimethylbenzimidazole synthase
MSSENRFSEADREAVYRAIFTRRDVRGQFLPTPVPGDVLHRILAAAHAAPSVGYSQPWDFLVIDDISTRHGIKADFDRQNSYASQQYSGERKALYESLKLEGILEAPLNVCVTCDRQRGGPNVLGRHSLLEADLFSTCLAVQNLWLAARTEGIGVGWVSILDHKALGQTLGLPSHVVPLAYLCVGYVSHFPAEPELLTAGWATPDVLQDRLHRNQWGQHDGF